MRVLIVTDAFAPDFGFGGPVVSLQRLIDSSPQVDFLVIARASRENNPLPTYSIKSQQDEVQIIRTPSWFHNFRQLRELVREWAPDVLYLTSLHSVFSSVTPLILLRLGLLSAPLVVISPRGEVSPLALNHKHVKKKFARHLIRFALPRNSMWHAMDLREVQYIDAWSRDLSRPLAVVIAPNLPPEPDRSAQEYETTTSEGVIFASRISPIKGLDDAILLVSQIPGLDKFDVYGSESDPAYATYCKKLAANVLVEGTARFMGAYSPSDLSQIFNDARVLLLPTKTESFGHAILEALAHGCVVMIPDTTPWTDLVLRCGGHILRDPDGSIRFMEEVLGESPSQHQTRREICRREYSNWYESLGSINLWDEVGAAMQQSGLCAD